MRGCALLVMTVVPAASPAALILDRARSCAPPLPVCQLAANNPRRRAMAAIVDQPRLSAKTLKAGFKVLPRISIDLGSGNTNVQGMLPREVNDIATFYTLLTYAETLQIMPPIVDAPTSGSPSVWMFLRDAGGGLQVVNPGSGADARTLAAIQRLDRYQATLRYNRPRLGEAGYATLRDRWVPPGEAEVRGGGGCASTGGVTRPPVNSPPPRTALLLP
jgi:hypothetical protein